ncbi:hypothetical protein DID78_06605, partial [Candidatus Marinamargulisbacteria bacterium SCGC AG-343-D04]
MERCEGSLSCKKSNFRKFKLPFSASLRSFVVFLPSFFAGESAVLGWGAGVHSLDVDVCFFFEDVGVWTLDISSFKSDLEDPNEQLFWQVSDDDSLLNATVEGTSNIITLNTKDNAWGTTLINLTLTDSDTNIDIAGYIPNPLSSSKEVAIQLNPVNDVPSLSTANMKSLLTSDTDIAMGTDTLQVEAEGYSDIGYDLDNRSSSDLGDEYDSGRNGELSFTPNDQYYSFKWFANGELLKYTQNSTQNIDTLVMPEGHDGKVIMVEAWPNDGEDDGDVVTQSMVVNNRPNMIDASHALLAPSLNYYTNEGEVDLVFPIATDLDDDEIHYRVRVWKVPKWDEEPTDTSLESSSYVDTHWFSSSEIQAITTSLNSLAHGTYFWKVWTGNKIQEFYDIKDPTWINYFNVDLIDPSISEFGDVVKLSEISAESVIQDAGNRRMLYGKKPSDVDDEYQYRIILSWENSQIDSETLEEVITTDSVVAVPYTTAPNWAYMVEYPEGTTTYNILLEDLATNIMTLNYFVITQDLIPPVPFEVFGAVQPNYEQITSKNKYYISGTKESDSGLFFQGYNTLTKETEVAQIVGFTNSPSYSFYIYPEKPSGNVFTADRAGNIQSQGTLMDIIFMQTPPKLITPGLSRTLVNAMENESGLLNFGISSERIESVTTVSLEFSSDRALSRYILRTDDGHIIEEGNNLEKSTTKNITFKAYRSFLDEGINEISLLGYDVVNNEVSENFTLTLKSVNPSTEIISKALLVNVPSNTVRNLNIFGRQQDNVTVFINNNATESYPGSAQTWFYIDNSFDISNNDIE